jgi:hypothetical protein
VFAARLFNSVESLIDQLQALCPRGMAQKQRVPAWHAYGAEQHCMAQNNGCPNTDRVWRLKSFPLVVTTMHGSKMLGDTEHMIAQDPEQDPEPMIPYDNKFVTTLTALHLPEPPSALLDVVATPQSFRRRF